ncbi:hypothetical protein JL720_7881 [Aureococcus anophagefferens]|nr:hypothetical protein JL720_7881 [Aureococcus anophagefferens]
MLRLGILAALVAGLPGCRAFVGNARDDIVKTFMEKVNVSAPGVVRDENQLSKQGDEFQPEWLAANGNTFKTPTKLVTLEELAKEKTVAVAATLSMAAARYYKVTIPNYALFSNHSGALETAVYPGDLDDAGDLEDWVEREKGKLRARPRAAAPACAPGDAGCAPVAATDAAAAHSASTGEL